MSTATPTPPNPQQQLKHEHLEDPDRILNPDGKHYPPDFEPPNGWNEDQCGKSSAPPGGEER